MTNQELIEYNIKNKRESKPLLIKAGDKKVLLNGTAPLVDCRVVAEENYQKLIAKSQMNEQVKQLIEKYEERKYSLEKTKSLLRENDYEPDLIVDIKLIEVNQFITDLKQIGVDDEKDY